MSKYHSIKTTIEGMTFDSRKEARRWQELSLLQSQGKISDLRRQVKFVLIPAQSEPDKFDYSKSKKGRRIKGRCLEKECAYYADFVYVDNNGKTVVEDVKGKRTEVYIIKRKLMLERYGIRVREI